jgi:hypothetical protein
MAQEVANRIEGNLGVQEAAGAGETKCVGATPALHIKAGLF